MMGSGLGNQGVSARLKIHKIYRIQNLFFYQQYDQEREMMKSKHKNDIAILANMEQKLFHGTERSCVPKINEKGFDRSYCGKHATAYGQGVYFAKQMEYAARDTYSPPTRAGKKFVYMARVLVGDVCKGDSSMRVLPESARSRRPFDCAVDDVAQPTIFVIFRDSQAYPEFLIVLK